MTTVSSAVPVTCLVIGDPHFMPKNTPLIIDFSSKLEALVSRLSPTFVVILGDLLHFHEKIHTIAFNLANDLILSLAKFTHVYLLIGNHDLINNTQFLTTNHPFNTLKLIDNITICDAVVCHKVSGRKFVFVPYVFPGRFREALDTCKKPWRDASCIFAHQEFRGARFNPVAVSTSGDEWPEDFPMIVSGHIHSEQRIQHNIYYPGSSIQEHNETSKKHVVLLSFPGSLHEQTQQSPKICKIDLELKYNHVLELNICDAHTYKHLNNTYTQLIFCGSSNDIKLFRRGQLFRDLEKLQDLSISFRTTKQKPTIDGTAGAATAPVRPKHITQILFELIEHDNEHVHDAFKHIFHRHIKND